VILVPRDLLRSGGLKQHRPPGKEQPLQLPQQGPQKFSELPSGNSKFPYSNPLHLFPSWLLTSEPVRLQQPPLLFSSRHGVTCLSLNLPRSLLLSLPTSFGLDLLHATEASGTPLCTRPSPPALQTYQTI
jgi:hypothetical protein